MKLQTKHIKRIKALLAFTIGFAAAAVLMYIENIFEIAESAMPQGATPFTEFCRGMAEGIIVTGFIIIAIIAGMLYRNIDKGKIFSVKIIYFVQIFGLFQIISAVCAGIGNTEGSFYINPYSVILGVLIIIFAQVFRIALRMQEEEELTI